jgi:prevent-host-death family protein
MNCVAHVNVHEAKTHFSRLLARVAAGEEIVIAKGDQPVARLVPYTPHPRRQFGLDRGRFTVPDDFDDPLPPDVLEVFER